MINDCGSYISYCHDNMNDRNGNKNYRDSQLSYRHGHDRGNDRNGNPYRVQHCIRGCNSGLKKTKFTIEGNQSLLEHF